MADSRSGRRGCLYKAICSENQLDESVLLVCSLVAAGAGDNLVKVSLTRLLLLQVALLVSPSLEYQHLFESQRRGWGLKLSLSRGSPVAAKNGGTDKTWT